MFLLTRFVLAINRVEWPNQLKLLHLSGMELGVEAFEIFFVVFDQLIYRSDNKLFRNIR